MSCCTVGKAAPDSYGPLGSITRIGQMNVYDVTLSTIENTKQVLLLLPDGFGLARHNLVLADKFAGEGWHVFVPDYFEGDPLPTQILKKIPGLPIDDHPWSEEDKQKLRQVDMPSWLLRHNHPRISSLLIELLTHLKQQFESDSFYGVGYCFGGKHVLQLASSTLVAAAACHPSFVESEDLKNSTVPVYVGLAEKDTMVPASLESDLQLWASMRNNDVPFTLEIYPGMPHGFAARPDSENENIRVQCERAFEKVNRFLQEYVP